MSPLVILAIFVLACLLVWLATTDEKRQRRRDPGAVPGDGSYTPHTVGECDGGGGE